MTILDNAVSGKNGPKLEIWKARGWEGEANEGRKGDG